MSIIDLANFTSRLYSIRAQRNRNHKYAIAACFCISFHSLTGLNRGTIFKNTN